MLLTTCFACSRDQMIAWADALKNGDEETQAKLQSDMPFVLELDLVTQTEVEALSVATGKRREVTGDITGDLIASANPATGPYVFSLDKDVVNAIAQAEVGEGLITAWIAAAQTFTDQDVSFYRDVLTEETARRLVDFSKVAREAGREAFMVAGG